MKDSDSKKKILIIPSWYATEKEPLSGIFFRELAESLVRGGAEVAILYFDIRKDIPDSRKGISHRVTSAGVHEILWGHRNYIPGVKGMELQKNRMVARAAACVEEWFGVPDVVHLESCTMVAQALFIREYFGAPMVYTEHLSNILNGSANKFYMDCFETAMRKADGVVAISSAMEARMRSAYPREIRMIPNGIDVSRLPLAKGDGRESKGCCQFKALGSLMRIKGYDRLIRGFAAFATGKGGRDVCLTIGGDGPERETLERLVSDLGLEDKVKLPGVIPREDVPEFYRDCDVFICSSSAETFSVVTAEALCSGIPVLSTRCGGPEDMIGPDDGILIDSNNEALISQGLEEIYDGISNFIGKEIRARAMEKFSAEKVAESHLKLYEEVI